MIHKWTESVNPLRKAGFESYISLMGEEGKTLNDSWLETDLKDAFATLASTQLLVYRY